MKKKLFEYTGKEPMLISCTSNIGIQELINKIKHELNSFTHEAI